MLKIENIAEFRGHVMHKEEMREADIGEGCTSFCYMISAEGTFDDAWSRECRGIVFNTAGGMVTGRPLHKFFNVGERAETRIENLDWSKVTRVMDKRDGSMIHTVWTMNGVRLKSKKTFESDVALAAEKWMHSEPDLKVWRLIQRLVAMEFTAIFEWTAPDARIVLHYPNPELCLLHVRHVKTGVYMDREEMQKWAEEFGVKCVDETAEFFADGKFDINMMVEAVKTREGVEGWVIQFEDGNMVKMKTEWYLKRHRAMTFIRERDIAQLVLDEGLDDMKSLLVTENVDISEILSIEARVLHDLRQLAMGVDVAVEADKTLSRKDFAIKYTGAEHFGLMMSKFIGKEPDFKGYFERNLLKDNYGLRQLVLVPSVAEGD